MKISEIMHADRGICTSGSGRLSTLGVYDFPTLTSRIACMVENRRNPGNTSARAHVSIRVRTRESEKRKLSISRIIVTLDIFLSLSLSKKRSNSGGMNTRSLSTAVAFAAKDRCPGCNYFTLRNHKCHTVSVSRCNRRPRSRLNAMAITTTRSIVNEERHVMIRHDVRARARVATTTIKTKRAIFSDRGAARSAFFVARSRSERDSALPLPTAEKVPCNCGKSQDCGYRLSPLRRTRVYEKS